MMPGVPAYPLALREFIRLFNQQSFFEAHEVLEGLWLLEKGELREFYQGLIQIAALFVHLQKQNPTGAKRLLQTAGRHLAGYQSTGRRKALAVLLSQAQKAVFEGVAPPRLALKNFQSFYKPH